MSTTPDYLPYQEPESLGKNLTGMFAFFIDPAAAARRVPRRWFWVAPFAVVIVVSIIAGFLLEPVIRQASELMPLRPGATPSEHQRAIDIGIAAQRVFTPISIAVMILIEALIVYGTAIAFSIKARFGEFLNLVAGCSLISVGLTYVANTIILRSKGEISSIADLTPPLGLDIFLPSDANKLLTGFLGYFSIFQLWWIVMMVLILSVAFRVTKGKALAIMAPLILLSLLMRIAVVVSRGH